MKKIARICALFGLMFMATTFVEVNPASLKIAHAEDKNEYVAEDGEGNKYTDIYDIAQNNTTSSIKLLSDVYLNGYLSFADGLRTFDFNGHRVRLTNDYINFDTDYRIAFYFRKTVGEIEIIDSGVGGGINTIVTGVNDYIPCFFTNNADVTLNIRAGTYVGLGQVVYSEKGNVNIYGGSYDIDKVNETDGNKYFLNCQDTNFAEGIAKIQVYGGTFKNYNPAKDANDGGSYVAEGCIISTTFTDDGYETVPTIAQVSINGSYYHYLEDALAVVKNGETIVFNDKAATNGVLEGPGIEIGSGYTMTIDLNGITYEVNGNMTGSTGSKTNGWHLLENSNITIKNGTLTKSVHYVNGTMLIQNYSNLTLDNVKLIGDDNVKYVLSSNHGDVVLKNNTEIVATEDNIALDICYWLPYYKDGLSLTIEDDTVKIDGKSDFYAYGGKITEENKDNMKFTIPNGYTLTLADGLQIVSSEDGTHQEVVRTSIYNAQQFARKWKEAREADGGLCGLVGTSKMTELLNEYDALDTDALAYLATAEDADGCTISESIAYFKTIHAARKSLTQNSNHFFQTKSTKPIQPAIIITVMGLLSIVGYYFIQKRKAA